MLRLIWIRLRNRRSQIGLSVLTVFFSVTLIFFLTLLWRGFSSGIEISGQRLGADMVVVPRDAGLSAESILYGGAPANIYMPKSIMGNIRNIQGVAKSSPQFFAYTLSEDCCEVGLSNRVIGFEPETDWVIGNWLASAKHDRLTDDEILVGGGVFTNKQERINVLGRSFRIAGRLEQTGTSLDKSLIVNIDTARKLVSDNEAVPLQELWKREGSPEALVSAVLIQVDRNADRQAIAQRIKGLGNVDVIIASEIMERVRAQYGTILIILELLSVLAAAGTLLQLFLRSYAAAFDHRIEWGLYLALGATRGQIVMLVVAESALLTAFGALLGLGGGYGVYYYISELIREGGTFPFVEPSADFITTAVLALVVTGLAAGGLAAVVPAYQCGRLDPGAVMQRGEYD